MTPIPFRNSPKLSFVEWNKYLDEIAGTKKVDVNEVKGKLVECGKPGLSGTTVRDGEKVALKCQQMHFLRRRSRRVRSPTV